MSECEHPDRVHEILAELTQAEMDAIPDLLPHGLALLARTPWGREHPEASVDGYVSIQVKPQNGRYVCLWRIPTTHDPDLDDLR